MAKTVLRFVVMSDVHVTENPDCKELKRLEKGLDAAYAYADSQPQTGLDAVVVVGDFANRGTEREMLNFKQVFYSRIRPETKTILSVASHEYCSGVAETPERMRRIFGMEPNAHEIIKGYHFISVSPEKGTDYEKPQQEYAFEELKKASDESPEKAIFFFQHAHLSGTVYGSIFWGEKELVPILMNFPQVIDFSGHSHAPINDPRNIHQEHFTSIGTGSISYTELDEFDKYYGTVPPDCEEFSQFLIVEADEDGAVTLKAYDIISGSFFPCDHTIKPPFLPENFIYTEKRGKNPPLPYFEDGTELTISREGDRTLFTFEQAKCEKERVNDYVVTVYRPDGTIIRRASAWSGYYKTVMPETVTVPVRDLPEGEYTVRVQARGFWHNISENALEAGFKI